MAATDESIKQSVETEDTRGLADKELEAVSGGAGGSERRCPECGSTDIRYISHYPTCMNCGYMSV